MTNLFSKTTLTVLALVLCTVFACKKKDDDMIPAREGLIASYQYKVSETNPFEVSFSNYSNEATSYSWDFGDGNSSSDESPTHTYTAGGDYTVILTASNGADNKMFERTITIIDPNEALFFLAGSGSKDWYLQREGVALGIGPALGDNSWWAFGGNTPLGDRPCILDDVFTFHQDGTWEFNSGGTVFVDSEGANGGWLPVEGCYDETEADLFVGLMGEDISAFANGGAYTYDYNTIDGTITIEGEGAYIGLSVKTNGDDSYIPESTKVYTISRLAEGPIADTLQMGLVRPDASAWNFNLVSYHDINDLPDIPGSAPAASFNVMKDGFTVNITNTSQSSTSYSWDFGDGGTSTDENPSYTYSAEGTYTITLTAMDDMGQSDMASQDVLISAATFDPSLLSSADGKIWKLDGEGAYYVGPNINDGSWWGGPSADDVTGARACQFDDEFIFTDGGNMEYDTKGEVYAEAYMGGPDACIDEGDLPSPYDVFASGMHSFSADATTITVMGNGAFFGFNKGNNDGELDGTNAPATEITYEVVDYAVDGNKEILTFAVNYGAGYWTMRVFSEN